MVSEGEPKRGGKNGKCLLMRDGEKAFNLDCGEAALLCNTLKATELYNSFFKVIYLF